MRGIDTLLLFVFAAPIIGIALFLAPLTTADSSYILAHYAPVLRTTLLLATGVSIGTLIITTLLLFAMHHIQYGRRIALFLCALPLIFPPYIGAVTYIPLIKSPWTLSYIGTSYTAQLFSAIGVLTLFLFPPVFLLVYERLRIISPAQKSIAALYNFSMFNKLKLVYLPHVKYALIGGITLVFLYSISDFGAVSILRMDTVTTELYQEMVTKYNKSIAAFISIVYLLFTTSIVLLTRVIFKDPVQGSTSTKHQMLYPPRSSIALRALAYTILGSIVTLSVIYPLYTIATWFFTYLNDTSTLKTVWTTTSTSLTTLGITTALVALSASLILVALTAGYYLMRAAQTRSQTPLPYLVAISMYALPGIIVAFGLFNITTYLPKIPPISWGTFIVGYCIAFSGISFASIGQASESIPRQLLYLGHSIIPSTASFGRHIVFPFTKGATLVSFLYVYFNAVRELTIPLLLMPLGVDILSVRIWQTTSEGLYTFAAPAIVVLLLLTIPVVVLYALYTSRS